MPAGYLTDAIAEIRDHGFTDTTAARLTALLNDAMWRVCAKEPWNFLEAAANLTITQGDDTPTLPTDFSKVLSLVIPGVGRVRPERRETIKQRFLNNLTDQGGPRYYYFIGDELHLYPYPDGAYTGVLDYLNWPAALVESTNENPPVPTRHRRVITLRALISGYTMDDDTEQRADAREEYLDRLSDMREDCLRSHYDEPDRVLIPTDDDFSDFFYS